MFYTNFFTASGGKGGFQSKGGKGGFQANPFGKGFDEILMARLEEADEFYATVIPPSLSPDAARVMR